MKAEAQLASAAADLSPSASPVIDQMLRHRSIRKYRNNEVPEALLQKILSAGAMASSSGNMQAYSIIVTQNLEMRKKLYPLHFNQAMVLEAPVLITFCADFHRMRRWLKLSEAPMNFDNPMSFMIAAIDAILVSQNVALAAESEGLGICYMGTTLANCQKIGRLLDCPEHVVPVVGFSLGYPDEAPPERTRLPLRNLVHQEHYCDWSDEEITNTYRERESEGWKRYMADPALRKAASGAGAKNLAQVYTKVKYTRESHMTYSETLIGYLQEQGFFG